MGPFDWIDKHLAQVVTGGIIIGLLASANRAFKEKDSPKAFLIRLLGGGSMAGFVSYLMSDIDMPKIIFGLIVWFVGWSSAEVGALLARTGKEKLEDTIGVEEDKTES